MVGGTDYNTQPFNLATQGQRQPGSAFKPFVLAEALRKGISPDSLWSSNKKIFTVPHTNGREKYVVNNYEDNYSGTTTLARATAFSDNSVFAEVGIKVGNGADRAAGGADGHPHAGLEQLRDDSLGGLKQGVTPLDMAHAYETLAERRAPRHGQRWARPTTARSASRRSRSRRAARTSSSTREQAAVHARAARGRRPTRRDSILQRRGALRHRHARHPWATFGGRQDRHDRELRRRLVRRASPTSYTVAVWVGYPDRLKPMKTEYRGKPVAGGTYPGRDLPRLHDTRRSRSTRRAPTAQEPPRTARQERPDRPAAGRGHRRQPRHPDSTTTPPGTSSRRRRPSRRPRRRRHPRRDTPRRHAAATAPPADTPATPTPGRTDAVQRRRRRRRRPGT